MRYRDAGVDVRRSDALKEAIGREVRSTWNDTVHPLAGGFAGIMRWPAVPGGHAPAGGALLAATLDGVGTKLHVALAANRLADAAADVVYHGANDLLVHGAHPVACLDYIAQARLDPAVVLEVVGGLARACREVGAVLLGGETAEMPDTYLPGVVDVAGCLLGSVSSARVLDGTRIRPGDRVLGIASAGLHTNGFSLARRVLSESGLGPQSPLPGGTGESIADALLAPHRWYGPALSPLLDSGRLHALAHVTGGGIPGNLVRVLPPGCRAVIDGRWLRPALFRWLIEAGAVPEDDASSALNLGVGMVMVVAPGDQDAVTAALSAAGERVFPLGRVETGERGVDWSPGS